MHKIYPPHLTKFHFHQSKYTLLLLYMQMVFITCFVLYNMKQKKKKKFWFKELWFKRNQLLCIFIQYKPPSTDQDYFFCLFCLVDIARKSRQGVLLQIFSITETSDRNKNISYRIYSDLLIIIILTIDVIVRESLEMFKLEALIQGTLV